jgi:hypothetical protein
MLQLAGHDDRALHAIGFAAAAAEWAMASKVEASSNTLRVAAFLSGPLPFVLRLLGTSSRRARQAAAASAVIGSLLTRLAWVEAGRKSADKYHSGSHLQQP